MMAQNKGLADERIAELKAAKEAEAAKAAEANMDFETDVAPSDDQAGDVMRAEDKKRYVQLKKEEEIFQAKQRKDELAHLERKKIERLFGIWEILTVYYV